MTTPSVAGPKPDLVAALNSTWRGSAEHLASQLSRFVRLAVVAAVPSVWSLAAGGKFDSRTLLAFVVPFAEVAWRQVFPALDAKKLDAADGATIVPDQVSG